MNDKISYNKYKKISEFVEKMDEKKVIEILKEQGDLTYKRKTVHSAVGAVGSILSTGGVGYVGYRALKGLFSQCARSCGILGLNTLKRQMCLAKCKMMVAQKEVQEINNLIGKCNKTKNPDKCKKMLQSKMKQAQYKVELAQRKFNKIQTYGMKKGKEAPEVKPGETKII